VVPAVAGYTCSSSPKWRESGTFFFHFSEKTTPRFLLKNEEVVQKWYKSGTKVVQKKIHF
jgi:hypothetical protein